MSAARSIVRDLRRHGVLVWAMLLSTAWLAMSMRMEVAAHSLLAKEFAAHAVVHGKGHAGGAEGGSLDEKTTTTTTTTTEGSSRTTIAVSSAPSPPEPCPVCPACPPKNADTRPPVASSFGSSPNPGAVTFVLVATMSPNAGPRAVALLASMQRFLPDPENSAVHALMVVVPRSEVAWWELSAAAMGPPRAFRVVILPEDSALATGAEALKASAPLAAAREFNGMGYRLQMLIKLGVAAHVPTDFYVTLDCDVVLAKPLRLGTLVRPSPSGDGMQGVLQGEMRGPHAARWMRHSVDMFFGGTVGSGVGRSEVGVECSPERLLRTVGVTPAVLSKEAALAVIRRLGAAADRGKRWDQHLMAALDAGADWTEYGLYAAGACLEGLLRDVHVHDPATRLYDPLLQEDGSWFRDSAAMARAFDPHGADVFVVLQSIGGSDAAEAAAALHPHVTPRATRETPSSLITSP